MAQFLEDFRAFHKVLCPGKESCGREPVPTSTSHPTAPSEVAQSCLTLCDPMDCSLLGCSIHRIFQARVLERVAISFSRGSSWPMDQTQVFHIAGGFFTIWATREAPRTLEWVAYTFSRGFSWLRSQTRVSCSVGRFFISWATRGALQCWLHHYSSWVKFKIIKN